MKSSPRRTGRCFFVQLNQAVIVKDLHHCSCAQAQLTGLNVFVFKQPGIFVDLTMILFYF